MTLPRIIEEAKYFCDEMKVTDRCTFCVGWLQYFKELAGKGGIRMITALISCVAQV